MIKSPAGINFFVFRSLIVKTIESTRAVPKIMENPAEGWDDVNKHPFKTMVPDTMPINKDTLLPAFLYPKNPPRISKTA